MRKYIIPILFFPLSISCSNGEGPIGARSNSLAHASSCLIDVWSSRNNQGSLGFIKQSNVGAFYENRFFVKELSQSGFASVVPIKKGTFGLAYSTIGYKLYRESHVTLCYGMQLNETVSLGIGMDYLTTRISDVYGKAHALTGSFGMTVKLLSNLRIATHVYNPFRTSITQYNYEKIPTIFKFGAQYIFSQKVFLISEAEKTSREKTNIKLGIEYNPASKIYLRVGGCTYPSQVSFGIGVLYKGLNIDVSSMFHSVLGVSPQIGLHYTFDKNNSKLSTQTNSN
jgi:hypothetical protein